MYIALSKNNNTNDDDNNNHKDNNNHQGADVILVPSALNRPYR